MEEKGSPGLDLFCLVLYKFCTLVTQYLVHTKTIEEGRVNPILGDFCLQIGRSTAGKNESLTY